eukprot:TRINITY_DN2012_c0_g1_i1.p1 TRINITY_DN2012_c0_g1~~TRINITY_DN2012_c0_g1_i1.p1  ORF type:complete len:474 (+),score=95.41 TRINITY_DN2012_c0_g1_i1:56-1423(+)
MSGIVRQSKYRHVFGKAEKSENQYTDLRLSQNAWDSNFVTSNTKFFAFCWQAGGGGALAVVPWSKTGKLEADYPLIAGHKNTVLDVHFNPFNDNVIASVSEDGSGKIWKIPDEGLTETIREPEQMLKGHRRQVGTVRWNPVASNILVTSSKDYSVKVWDATTGDASYSIDKSHKNFIQSTEWNYNGSLILTAAKDKKARILDPRDSKVALEIDAHTGVKGMRGLYLGNSGKFATVGFSRNSDRQMSIWDPAQPDKPVWTKNIDTSSGLLMPFFDADTGLLFLAGKGDGNIRYFELNDACDEAFYINDYKSNTPQKGMDMYPKIGVNVNNCEVVRLLKMTKNSLIPIAFTVPRRGSEDMFQDDIFPDTYKGEAALSGEEWRGGKDADPILVSLEGGFSPTERAQSDYTAGEKQEEDVGPSSEAELRKEWKRLSDRVAYLEAELSKKDAQIAELKAN